MTKERLALGRFGESAAAAWYVEHDYLVEQRNYRNKQGEIDLIVTTGRCVVFVEVKTRTTRRFGGGAAAVDHRKQQRIRRVALGWLADAGRAFNELRFDVVESDSEGNLTVWEAAF